jgi:integrase/recombinase XerD
MTATTTIAALVPIQPVFSDAERLALAGFLAGYRSKVVTIPLAPRTARAIDLALA